MRKKRSFTLIELLIAASIFTVIILSLYSAFSTGSLSYKKIDSAYSLYQAARMIFNKVELDLKNSCIYADDDSKFKADTKGMDFFTKVDAFDTGGNINTVFSRVVYSLDDTSLKRSWYKGEEALIEGFELEPQRLSSNVKDIKFQYYSGKTDAPWQDYWPKEEDPEQKANLPLAVKIEVTLEAKDEQASSVSPEGVLIFTRSVSLPTSIKK